MRVTGGHYRNRVLVSPKGKDVRPTTDMVRQALFNRLLARTTLEGVTVLDLFSGSGSLGIEALSRGADKAVFVDSSSSTCEIVAQNLRALGEEGSARIVQSDVFTYLLGTSDRPHIILADPPYALSDLDKLVDLSLDVLSDDGYLVLEHDSSLNFDEHPNFVVSGKYGRTKLTFFRAR